MRGFGLLSAVAALLLTGTGCAQPAPTQNPEIARPDPTPPPPVDYANPANWMCRPGVDDGTCSANLDAMTVAADGKRTPAPYKAAGTPKIDCFYIYPTASSDPMMFSDLVPDAGEKRAVHGQAARLGEACRLFAPIYHQFTSAALRYGMAVEKQKEVSAAYTDIPYRDVVAAWRAYLKRDNQGRGVVIIGHSQGAMLLKMLLAQEIDGKPAQKLLVGAYLAGNPDLTTDSFRSIKPCAALGQTGCVTAWSSYLETSSGAHIFGAAKPGKTALCVNPAAPGGGRGLIKAYLTGRRSRPKPIRPMWRRSARCRPNAWPMRAARCCASASSRADMPIC
jgi:pimeloyl-ACP methyl ester carboxylesterase